MRLGNIFVFISVHKVRVMEGVWSKLSFCKAFRKLFVIKPWNSTQITIETLKWFIDNPNNTSKTDKHSLQGRNEIVLLEQLH